MNYKVSIIIPVYNGSNYMREAIDSALAQTYKNIEILVINDGSKDNGATREIALSYGDKIRYFEKENGGVSTALNLGIKVMNGDYFSWLSHDDVYYPEKVEREIEAIKAAGNGRVVVYSGWDSLLMPEKQVIPFNGSLVWDYLPNSILETGVFLSMFGLVSGCSLLIPRKLLQEENGFDEKYRCIQDYKLWFDAFRGKKVIYVRDRLIQSRMHPEQVTNVSPLMDAEEDFLYKYMAENISEKDIVATDVSLYELLSYYAFFCERDGHHGAAVTAFNRLTELDEPSDLKDRIVAFIDKYHLHEGDDTYLYCAGRYGRTLLEWFDMMGIEPRGIADGATELHGKKVNDCTCLSLEEIPKNSHIIVSKGYPKDVIEDLKLNGFEQIVSLDEMMYDLLITPVYKAGIKNTFII